MKINNTAKVDHLKKSIRQQYNQLQISKENNDIVSMETNTMSSFRIEDNGAEHHRVKHVDGITRKMAVIIVKNANAR